MSSTRHGASVLAVFAVFVASPSMGKAEIPIAHTGVQCVVAERFPRLEAQVPVGVDVGRARVHFRPESSKVWYSVDMTRRGHALAGTLPKPKKSLPGFRYYIEVTDVAFASSRTAEYAPVVAGNAAGCAQKVQAVTETTAVVVLVPAPGAPPLPAGFASSGVTTASVGSAAGATAGAGGGIGATTAIVGGVVVAVGAGLAVVGGGGDGGSDGGSDGRGENGGGSGGNAGGSPGGTPGSTPSPAPSPGATPALHVVFEPSPGMDVSPCAGTRLTWSSQALSPRADGSFDQTWAPNEPNTMRVAGRATATTFEATLTCVSGGPSGSINASGSADLYRGSFDFRGSRGTVTIERR